MQRRPILLCVLAVGCVGLSLFIAGFATPEWMVSGDITVGYWKTCIGGDCQDTAHLLEKAGGLYAYSKALLIEVRVFEIVGILSAAVGLVLVFLRILLPSVYSKGAAYRAAFLLLLLGGAIGIYTAIRFCGFSFCESQGGYSLYINIAGICIFIASGIAAAFAKPEVTVPEDKSSIL